MPSVHRLSYQDVLEDLQWMRKEHHRQYLAMYSSWFGGILRDPPFMLLPVDDHLVHSGDGVFEGMKLAPGGIYLLEWHLDRLERSAERISLPLPFARQELERIVLETARAAEAQWGCVRLFLSRGPGDFSPSPGGSIGSQLYVVVTALAPPSSTALEQGCSLCTVNRPQSPGHLPDGVLAREALERGADFAVSRDGEGRLGEGAAESFAIITPREELVVPSLQGFRSALVERVMELARELGGLSAVEERPLYAEDFGDAKEILVFGPTLDVLPVVELDGRRIGDGLVGPWSRCFLELVQRDMEPGSKPLTPLERKG